MKKEIFLKENINPEEYYNLINSIKEQLNGKLYLIFDDDYENDSKLTQNFNKLITLSSYLIRTVEINKLIEDIKDEDDIEENNEFWNYLSRYLSNTKSLYLKTKDINLSSSEIKEVFNKVFNSYFLDDDSTDIENEYIQTITEVLDWSIGYIIESNSNLTKYLNIAKTKFVFNDDILTNIFEKIKENRYEFRQIYIMQKLDYLNLSLSTLKNKIQLIEDRTKIQSKNSDANNES